MQDVLQKETEVRDTRWETRTAKALDLCFLFLFFYISFFRHKSGESRDSLDLHARDLIGLGGDEAFSSGFRIEYRFLTSSSSSCVLSYLTLSTYIGTLLAYEAVGNDWKRKYILSYLVMDLIYICPNRYSLSKLYRYQIGPLLDPQGKNGDASQNFQTKHKSTTQAKKPH